MADIYKGKRYHRCNNCNCEIDITDHLLQNNEYVVCPRCGVQNRIVNKDNQ